MNFKRPYFPGVIDNTMRSAFVSCPRKFQLEYLENWHPASTNVHLHAGKAYAKGLEMARVAFYEQGLDADTARGVGLKALFESYGSYECPADSAKSLERMSGALEFYFDRYPLETDPAQPIVLPGNRRGIEFNFAEPIDVKHPVTGDPLIYCGRMDTIVDYAGAIFGEDDKTTSSLGASWSRQWDLRSQFTGYCWGAAQAGLPLSGFLIRGVSILKTKYDTMEAITYRPKWMIERWYEQLIKDLTRAIKMWEDGYFDYNLADGCNEYGGCIFKQACMSEDPTPWLEGGFVKRVWNPLDPSKSDEQLANTLAGKSQQVLDAQGSLSLVL